LRGSLGTHADLEKVVSTFDPDTAGINGARASSDGGIVRPSAFAVLRLTISSNFVGCSIGRSPGCAPL
jgi:hypothetical protein